MAASPERRREIADFFAAHERDVRQSVAYRVRHLPAAAIADACQTAWERLSCRSDVDDRATGPRMIGDRGAARGVAALPSRARGNASRIPDATLVVIPAGHGVTSSSPGR